MIYLGSAGLPNWLLLVIMAAASLVAGAVWGMIPAVFKAQWNTNETLFTLMMNYIAIQLTSFFIPIWEHPAGSNTVGTINSVSKAGWFSPLFGQMYGLNVLIVVLLTVAMFIYLKYSKHGYEIGVVGESENTARYAAINVKKVVIRSMTLSGAICGLAGFLAVAGADHTISTDTSGGRGFIAIIVAWLAKFNTLVMVLIAAMIVFLDKGAIAIASKFQLSNDVSNILTGVILFFILGSEFFINYRVKFAKITSDHSSLKLPIILLIIGTLLLNAGSALLAAWYIVPLLVLAIVLLILGFILWMIGLVLLIICIRTKVRIAREKNALSNEEPQKGGMTA